MATRRKPDEWKNITKKICPRCEQEKPLEAFYEDKRKNSGRASECKVCKAIHTKYMATRNRNLQRKRKAQIKYSAVFREIEQLLIQQDNKCSICDTELSYEAVTKKNIPHIDHDHETGFVRGLLCLTCNTGIGMFKDSVEVIAKALAYLETSKISQRERLSELAPPSEGDATVRSHGKNNHEKPVEIAGSPTIQ